MSVKMTDEQINAVERQGRVIVSASAGSGKTFVMIKRVTSYLLGGGDVRKILAVTFTNKAAAQMKEKLRKALIEQVATCSEEVRRHVKEQLAYLSVAEISTIDSFCARLLRNHFYLLGLNPAFRITDMKNGAEGKTLVDQAMDRVFEAAYEQKDCAFFSLLSVYFKGKKDANLRKIVLELYEKVRVRADYKQVLEKNEDCFDRACDYLYQNYLRQLNYCLDELERVGTLLIENKTAMKFCANMLALFTPVVQESSLFGVVERVKEIVKLPSSPPSTKATGEELVLLLRLKSLREKCSELKKELCELSDEQEEREFYEDARARANAICALTLQFDEAYSALKREEDLLDYTDLGQLALRLLQNEEVLRSVKGKYERIFVDEYQDVNPLQEELISAISGENVFLVGDAKQSIYAFRGSSSAFFMQKTQTFPHSLALSENFRSAPAVIEAVNRVFSYAMTPASCPIDYHKEGRMKGGRRYQDEGGEVFFRFYEKSKKEQEERGIYSVLNESEEESDAQAEEISSLIESELGKEWYDADEGVKKRVRFGDIAVLVRKKSGDAKKIVSLLSKRNIPVTTTAEVNICDFWEVKLVVDVLSFLDNAEQDIPLVGTMLSRLGGFCEEELIAIRKQIPKEHFFRDAVQLYASMQNGLGEKIRAFFERMQKLRVCAQCKSASQMIGLLLSMGLEGEIAAKQDGFSRLKRVRRLMKEGENCSVNAFLHRLKTTNFDVRFSESGGEDAVKVITMHASKGLEYPVVILASLQAPFHGADSDEVVYSDSFSLAPKSFSLSKKLSHTTVLRRAIAAEQIQEGIKDELNVLYVAMTRAKYRLYMLFQRAESALAPQFATRFSEMIDFSACEDYFCPVQEPLLPPLVRNAYVYQPDQSITEEILHHFQTPYPYRESTALPVKASATALKREQTPAPTLERGEGGADIQTGLAYHAFLEQVEFGKGAREELSRMKEEGLLTEEELSLLQIEQLEGILSLPSFKNLQSKQIWREQKFLAALSACEIAQFQVQCKDELILQGAIDLLVYDGEYTVLDYKFSGRSAEGLRESYGTQISIYKKAVAKMMRVPEGEVKAKILNILRLEEIEIV